MLFGKKVITTDRGTEELKSGVEVWTVEWTQRYGDYSGDTKQAFQAFTDKDEADKFADSLRQAYKLIGQRNRTNVDVYRQNNGL